MNTRTLGIIGMISSPFLALDFWVDGVYQHYQPSVLSGVFGLIYMTGWLGCIVALYRLRAAGSKPLGKAVLILQMVLLSIAQVSNVYAILDPTSTNTLFQILDLAWPVSNCCMFFTGLAVLAGKGLPGWRRYIPLVVGLWFPVCLVFVRLVFGETVVASVAGLYSATAWLLLGVAVYTTPIEKEKIKIDLEDAISTLRASA